jgi:putative oxidoreductase
LQRLFTTFAEGWPGFGLLVQRLVTGITLLHEDIVQFKETATAATSTEQAMAALLALLIMIGLWTPLTGVLIACIEVWTVLLSPVNPATKILLAALGATLAIIGPGAFSIDARLFGRKHISG